MDPSAALNQVTGIWKNVQLIAPSARSSLTLFELGAGDALITYEQDARLALDRGVDLEIVYPSPTILAQPVGVAIEKNISLWEHEAAEAFLAFLISSEAQDIFSSYYLRPISPKLSGQFPPIDTFTCSELGGCQAAFSEVLKPYWEKEIFPKLSLIESQTLYISEKP